MLRIEVLWIRLVARIMARHTIHRHASSAWKEHPGRSLVSTIVLFQRGDWRTSVATRRTRHLAVIWPVRSSRMSIPTGATARANWALRPVHACASAPPSYWSKATSSAVTGCRWGSTPPRKSGAAGSSRTPSTWPEIRRLSTSGPTAANAKWDFGYTFKVNGNLSAG